MKGIVELFSLIFVLVICSFNNVNCEVIDNCNFRTCGECIGYADDTCVWCSQEVFEGSRCKSLKSLAQPETKTWCKKEFLINPQPSINVMEDKNFGESLNNITVQLKPQLINMKARPGVDMKFNISYKPAKDFPLDVYYLMDTSYTMSKKMSDLKFQAENIYYGLLNYTNNVQLGAGSFVEKPGFPFFDINRDDSHAFKNHVPLTNDMKQFTTTIQNITFGSNYDDPEAGLDALMQVMTCEPQIRWRKGARRIIVLCTDSVYHSAGDGKFIGAIKPNDMKCHLENNSYTMASTYDYPSVSQINKVASDEKFQIIFAITENNETKYTPEREYRALVKHILGAKYAELEDETSIIKIIKEAYEESSRTVKLESNLPDSIKLTVDQDCHSEPKINCESKHNEATVTIPGTLTVLSCPSTGNTQKIEISAVGYRDKVMINLEIDCKCDCEKERTAISPKCNNAGGLQCGICKCNPGRHGVDCRCNSTSTDQKDMEKCKLKPEDSQLCSGKGKCMCGKCEECKTGFSGDFCQFDDNSCPSPNNHLCFGKGYCTLGHCVCVAGWTGKDCSCPDDTRDCFAPYSKEVCSGNGVCRCGACVCNALENNKNETYSGAFCDNCEECAEKRCKELEDYAYCNYEHMDNKEFCDQQNNVTQINVNFVNKTEFNGPKLYMAKWCKKELENGTFIVFKYQYNNHNLKVTIQKELESPPEANLWIAAGSAIGIVLLIGILTVIVWKILVDLHDKREYRKFADEAASAGYDVSLNPIYQNPRTTFVNPICDELN